MASIFNSRQSADNFYQKWNRYWLKLKMIWCCLSIFAWICFNGVQASIVSRFASSTWFEDFLKSEETTFTSFPQYYEQPQLSTISINCRCDYPADYQKFRQKYAQSSQQLQNYRYLIYSQNINKINAHNSNPYRTYNMAVNKFADLTTDQFLAQYTSLWVGVKDLKHVDAAKPTRVLQTEQYYPLLNDYSGLPQPPRVVVDWHCKDYSIKNQGKCGGCYAFVATQAIEFLYKIYKPNSVFNLPLSVQEVISCSDNQGCRGGSIYSAFQYIKESQISLEIAYPFTSFDASEHACSQSNKLTFQRIKIKSFRKFKFNDCQSVVEALKNKTVAAGVSAANLQFYQSGLFSEEIKDTDVLNHGILLMGFNYKYGFHFKNSWGIDWGENGYGWLQYWDNAGVCMDAYAPAISEQEQENSQNRRTFC